MPELRYEDPNSNFNYLRMQTKRCQRSERAVNAQCIRSDNSMYAVEAPWERLENAGNRHLKHRRTAMELSRHAKVAVITPWERRDFAIWEF